MSDLVEREAAVDLAEAVGPLVERMTRMLMDDYCDCPPEGHMCGGLKARAEVLRVQVALARYRAARGE